MENNDQARLDIRPILEGIQKRARQKKSLKEIRANLNRMRDEALSGAYVFTAGLPKYSLDHFKGKYTGVKRPLAYVLYGVYKVFSPGIHLLWRYFRLLDVKSGKDLPYFEICERILAELETLKSGNTDADA